MEGFPSAQDLINEANKLGPIDLNDLHSKTYTLMIKYKESYYRNKVDKFLATTTLKEPELSEIRKKMLMPIKVDNVIYSNFMEEASRRISQAFQPLSGNIAELCVKAALDEVGLIEKVHYLRKKNRSDFTFYYPDVNHVKKQHRLEVKNVKLRERGARGLVFDGDSLMGFFDSPEEFTEDNVRVIDENCLKTNGYCYLPPNTLQRIKYKTKRFKSDLNLAKDMKEFVQKGII